MKKISVIGATLLGAAVLVATPVSLHQYRDTGLSLSVDKAQAVIGRPLSAGSVAGVHRLSITHNSCADRGAQPDIGETGQAAPHHDVPRRRIIGAREVSA